MRPQLLRDLFENGGAGPLLREDIIPEWAEIKATGEGALELAGTADAKAQYALDVGGMILHAQDQKPTGTGGGAFTAGAWRVRDLNTVLSNTIPGASLANNAITLPAGKYWVSARVSSGGAGGHQGKLTSSDGTIELLGSSEWGNTAYASSSNSTVQGSISLEAEATLTLQHHCTSTNSNGFGMASNAPGVPEIYSELIIRRMT